MSSRETSTPDISGPSLDTGMDGVPMVYNSGLAAPTTVPPRAATGFEQMFTTTFKPYYADFGSHPLYDMFLTSTDATSAGITRDQMASVAVGTGGIFGSGGAITMNGGYDRAPAEKIVNAFESWKAKNSADAAQHAEYLADIAKAPGRQATILTDRNSGPGLLTGGMTAPKQSLLG